MPGSVLLAGACPIMGCSFPLAGFHPGPANLTLPSHGEIRLVTISVFFSSFQTENYSFDSNYVNSRAHLIKRYVGFLEGLGFALPNPKGLMFFHTALYTTCLFYYAKLFKSNNLILKQYLLLIKSHCSWLAIKESLFFLLFGFFMLGRCSK